MTVMRRNRLVRTARRAQGAHEGAMVDFCTIVRPSTAEGVLNAGTGQYEDREPSDVYEGRCQLVTPERVTDPSREDTPMTISRDTLKVPVGAGPFEIGDVAHVTKMALEGSDAARAWRVVGVPPKRWQTHQLLEVQEVTARG